MKRKNIEEIKKMVMNAQHLCKLQNQKEVNEIKVVTFKGQGGTFNDATWNEVVLCADGEYPDNIYPYGYYILEDEEELELTDVNLEKALKKGGKITAQLKRAFRFSDLKVFHEEITI